MDGSFGSCAKANMGSVGGYSFACLGCHGIPSIRLLILRDPQLPLPATLAMDVERVPFFISISAEEFQRRLEKTGSLEICHWSSKATRANFSSVDYGRISGDLGFGWDKTKALVMVDNAVEILAQPNDCVGLLPGEHEADKIIEGKMIEIAQILGIFMEGKLGEMSRFIREMLTRRRGVVNTKRFLRGGKKTKTLRELEKSATSINYDRQVGDGKMGVQLVGI